VKLGFAKEFSETGIYLLNTGVVMLLEGTARMQVQGGTPCLHEWQAKIWASAHCCQVLIFTCVSC
jgi:hypothetical protein